ncbi:ubinuclein-1-like [Rutidosis leptorrhynchoides]|uniref:ubinuclein-1-like n=1 Tax=Rutidosis leptorrhynchoides TaxID=125765 RepID=UPI003A992639
MAEEKTGIGVSESPPSSSAEDKAVSTTKSSFIKKGDRKLFSVNLRPGDTTTVSWRRLVKDANKLSNGSNSVHSPPKPIAHPNLESRTVPGQPTDKQMKDEGPHRFSAVIEKIERLYMGNDSSDDELNNIPDDDQYDTDDSFIDDAELDEYFEVDNSAIKHDGYFVNRGKLERIEPAINSEQQEKKRKRQVLPKTDGEIDDARKKNKRAETGKVATEKSLFDSFSNVGVRSENFEVLRPQNQLNSGSSAKRKSTAVKLLSPCSSLRISNGDASASLTEPKEIEKPKVGVLALKSNKSKDGPSDISHQKLHNKNAAQSQIQPAKVTSNTDVIRMRGKNGIRELPDLNVSDRKSSMLPIKPSPLLKRDGSNIRSKVSILEKAIKELEKVVAECRPPATDNQVADPSSLAVKRRLPREVKLKLAKVARVEHAIYGKITKEMISRLDGILGHLIQLRSLKRNLKDMVSSGLSAKQEKDNKFQQIKKEVMEMIRSSSSTVQLKQQAGTSHNFQETDQDQIQKTRCSMDAVIEDKICDLHDFYTDGLDEDAGPQLKKLYAELAGLWPKGLMDDRGIKRAILRAKERKRALHYSRPKDDENKIKKRKITAESARVDTGLMSAQAQYSRGKKGTVSASKPKLISNQTTRISSPSNMKQQEKLKGISTNQMAVDSKMVVDDALMKKKLKKRKPEQDLDQTHFRSLATRPGEEREKPSLTLKHSSSVISQPQKTSSSLDHPS